MASTNQTLQVPFGFLAVGMNLSLMWALLRCQKSMQKHADSHPSFEPIVPALHHAFWLG